MNLCGLCFEICSQDSKIEGDLKNVLKFCISEIDLDITRTAVICKTCEEDLTRSYALKKKSLSTQRKIMIIKKQWLPSSLGNVSTTERGNSQKIQESMDQDNAPNDNHDSFDQFDSRKRNLVTSSPLLVHEQSRIRNIRPKINCAETPEKSLHLDRKIMDETKENSEDSTSSREKPVYTCGKCSYITRYKMCLKKHRLTCPVGSKRKHLETPKLACNICSQTYETREKFSEHMFKEHDMVLKMFKCDSCKFRASTAEKLMDHERIHKQYKIKNSSKKKNCKQRKSYLDCTFDGCNKRFLSKKGWQYHVNTHYRSRSPNSEPEINSSPINNQAEVSEKNTDENATKTQEPTVANINEVQVINQGSQEDVNFDLPEILPEFQDEDIENGFFHINLEHEQNDDLTIAFALQSPQSEMYYFLSAESTINDRGDFIQPSNPPPKERAPPTNPDIIILNIENLKGPKSEQIPTEKPATKKLEWN